MRSALKRWSLEAENPRKSGYRPPAPHVSRATSSTDLTAQWLRRDSYIFLSHFIPLYTPPPGTRQTLTTVPDLLVPLHCTIPGALLLPPPLFLCMQRPTRMQLVCLGACIAFYIEAARVPSGPWNHRSPRGAFTLLGPDWDQIPYTRFLFDFW